MERQIVIIGGGAIGSCTAYYLSRQLSYEPGKHSITLIEANDIASGSSGKGGGLIAAWAEPTCLAQASFKLHAALAAEHEGERQWGYRTVFCADCDATATPQVSDARADGSMAKSSTEVPEKLDWIPRDRILSYKQVGSPEDTAQCLPLSFTKSVFAESCKRGVQLLYGNVTSVEQHPSRMKMKKVHVTSKSTGEASTVDATDVIIAAGPWSGSIIPEASVSGARCHSVVLRPSRVLPNNMLFMNVMSKESEVFKLSFTPEIYPRPDGTVYACEAADPSHPLPVDSASVIAIDACCDKIRNAVSSVSPVLEQSEYLKRQVCYQPVIVVNGKRKKLAGPFVGAASMDRVWLACGHDSWGISNAPATGKAISEMVFDGKATCVDVDELSVTKVMQRARAMPDSIPLILSQS